MTTGHLREVSSDGVFVPGDVAAELYASRLERGIDLHDVADELRIRYEFLLAIEEGRFKDLPGPAYVIGFLRSYAMFLNLDADDLVRRFKTETTEFDSRQDLNALEPYDEGGVPTGALMAIAMVLAAAAYGGWYFVANSNDVAVNLVPEVPERMIAAVAVTPQTPGEAVAVSPMVTPEEITPTPQPVEVEALEAEAVDVEAVDVEAVDVEAVDVETVAVAVEADPAPTPDTASLAEPAGVLSREPFDAILAAFIERNPDDNITSDPDALSPSSQDVIEVEPLEAAPSQSIIPAPVIETIQNTPRVFGQANAGSAILLRAREESWVQVTGADNELLLTRILRPGDIYYVPDRTGLMLMTGNAGGIDILVDGKLTPSLGKIGKVRRQVALDPVKLLAGNAVEP